MDSTLAKKYGTYARTLRDIGGIRQTAVQRHRCLQCGKTFSDPIPEIAPRKWYTRRVQRKFLDLHVIGVSLRNCANCLTAEITGKGRTFQWDVLARLPWWGRTPEPELEIELSHTTGWRWEQAAGESWRKRKEPYAEIPQSGIVASDGVYVPIRDISTAVLGIVDGLKRTAFGLFPLKEDESDEEIERAFAEAEHAGLNLEGIKVLVSDGASGFQQRRTEWPRTGQLNSVSQ